MQKSIVFFTVQNDVGCSPIPPCLCQMLYTVGKKMIFFNISYILNVITMYSTSYKRYSHPRFILIIIMIFIFFFFFLYMCVCAGLMPLGF